jgi:hypothetical protein
MRSYLHLSDDERDQVGEHRPCVRNDHSAYWAARAETYGPPRLQVILSSTPFSVCFNVSGLGLLSPAKMEIRASRSS